MTTTLTTSPSTSMAAVPIRPLRFSTLLSVELRKMTDTRSGRWLLASIVGLVGAVLVYRVAQTGTVVAFDGHQRAVTNVIAFLAPIIGLLAMTSEWTQRTALTTFTLAPRRLPVLAAKYVAAVGLSLAVLAAGLVMTAAATGIDGLLQDGASFTGWASAVRAAAIVVVLQVTMAAAFGALAAQSVAALVAYLAAPTAWAMASDALLGRAAPWFDIFGAYDQLSSGHPFENLGQTLTAVTVWVIVPAVVGISRSLHREVK